MESFQCTADREALNALKSTGALPYLVDRLLLKPREQEQREFLSRRQVPLSSFKGLERLVEECAHLLSLESLPELYVINGTGSPNAFTFGNDDAPTIVLDRRLVETLVPDELRALLGHEMGHIKSRHLLYHRLADCLASGVEISSSLMGLNLIPATLRLALLAWHRESEFSADRASLISSGNPDHVASMFARLIGRRRAPISQGRLLEYVAEIFQSHPNLLERIRAVYEFSRSRDYAAIVQMIRRRIMFREAFASKCQFCGASKPVESIFCPECERSQV